MSLSGIPDAGAFLARLVRLDRGAPVRLRPSGPRVALWGHLPWDVLVTRDVDGTVEGDVTVSAAELLATLAASSSGSAAASASSSGSAGLPPRRDADWRWPLPPVGGTVVEHVAAAELTRLAAAAAGTLREVTGGGLGRAVGQRIVRDALLDHVALVVTTAGGDSVEIPQRLVQAVSRMGFLGPADVEGPDARVLVSGRWVGLSAPYGVAWLQRVKNLAVMPISTHPKG